MNSAERFQNRFRIRSSRAPFWDYGGNASYFVTLCTQGRIRWFGEVVHGNMERSDLGEMAHRCWMDIPNHFPFVQLGAFVVMPDHVHGIITLDKPVDHQNHSPLAEYGRMDIPVESPENRSNRNQFGAQSQNLGSIVRGFKIGVTLGARAQQPEFRWQGRYHDRIVRDEVA